MVDAGSCASRTERVYRATKSRFLGTNPGRFHYRIPSTGGSKHDS